MTLARGESLALSSLEGFLSDREIGRIQRAVDKLRRAHPADAFTAGKKEESVHHLESFGLSGREAARVFAPAGRIEIELGEALPEVRALLDDAFFRRIEDIRRFHASACWPRGWTYVEYGPGQICTTHADGTFDGTQVGACSVRLDDDAVGGEFFIETCGSSEIWMSAAGDPELLPSAVYDNAWLRAIPKTRWVAQCRKGTALFWGAQVFHGTHPVIRGAAKKIIAWIEAA